MLSHDFLPHDAMHSVDYATTRRLSVRFSHAGIVSKGLNIIRHRVATPFWFSRAKPNGNNLMETP